MTYRSATSRVALLTASAGVLAAATTVPHIGTAVAESPGTRVTVHLAAPAPVRAAVPVVVRNGIVLGVGTLSADRRSVSVDPGRRSGSGTPRIVWTGGGAPDPRSPAPAAHAPYAPAVPAQPPAPAPAPEAPAVLDPGTPGSLATERQPYWLGDTVLTLPSRAKVELGGEVTYPAPLGDVSRPLVVLLHGLHDVCGKPGGDTIMAWPCPGGYGRIPSEQGYRSLATLLASHGMVVVSVAANGLNALSISTDWGARDRAFLVTSQLKLWQGWAGEDASGPFGTRFRGALDFSKVGLVGHSRAGEGVVTAVQQNLAAGSPFGIGAVVTVAPTNFTRPSVRGVPSLSVVPYCDGDVSDLPGVHYFDDAAEGVPDSAPHTLLTLLGANHNFFNAIWSPGGWEAGAVDDWYDKGDPVCGAGTGRLTQEQQRAAGNAYLAAFLRARLSGETAFDEVLAPSAPAPASAAPARTALARAAGGDGRLLVSDARSLTTNALGGLSTATGFSAVKRCGGNSGSGRDCFAAVNRGDEPHLIPPVSAPGATQLNMIRLTWKATGAAWSNAVPAAQQDVSRFSRITARIAANPWRGVAAPPEIALRLVDGSGAQSVVPLSSPALTLPVNVGDHQSYMVPHALSLGAEVPLDSFAGVDMHRIASVQLVGAGPAGDITVADVSFQR